MFGSFELYHDSSISDSSISVFALESKIKHLQYRENLDFQPNAETLGDILDYNYYNYFNYYHNYYNYYVNWSVVFKGKFAP